MPGTNDRKILLVDDDPLVRATIAEALIDEGFVVLQAANASEAVAVLQARADVLAVISDIDMPGTMNGISLAWEIKNQWPNTPVTLISGRVHPPAGTVPEDVVFVAKPLRLSVMVEHAERMVSHALPGADKPSQ
ncbi:response regulator [Salinarimonas soli]|uniref:Response regulator n=1 Tax=Salinarimonas soli TaxID=1638099 RepID=A0A5B2VAW8_9HYPH|nr:response regulator [Salinarimonas soli]KAA2235926.1 response regulator [Salinarimonas soli]